MQHKFTPTTHLKRAALTLLALILTCATAWAQTTQSVTYIDENGQTQTVNATQITSDNLRMGSDRWYYVSGTVDVNAPLTLMTENGTHNLILCDGATLTVSQVKQNYSKYAKLKVYGQSGGTGKLNVGNVSMMNAIFNCDFALLFRIGAFHQFCVGKLFCFIIQPADRQHNSFAGFIIEFCVARTDQMSKAIGRVFKKSIEL